MNRQILIHGFNVWDNGKETVDRLKLLLKNPVDFDYGFFWFFSVRLRNKSVAKRLLNMYKYGDTIYAHSNAADIVMRAVEMGLNAKDVIFIHPALDVDDERLKLKNYESLTVFYGADDWILKLARFMPFHNWGAMGAYGAKIFDKRITNKKDGMAHSEGFLVKPEFYVLKGDRK